MVTSLLLAACLCSQVGPSVASKAGVRAIEEAGQRTLVPDKHGFMQWQWIEPSLPGSRGASGRIEHAIAKFIGIDKNNVVTIKTDMGRTVKIPRAKIGRQQEAWLAKELAAREAKKAK